MAWDNGKARHTHEFRNFQINNKNSPIKVGPFNGGLKIQGKMDGGTNGVVFWPDVPSQITR